MPRLPRKPDERARSDSRESHVRLENGRCKEGDPSRRRRAHHAHTDVFSENADVPPRKIRHVTTVHAVDDPRIFHKECRSLAARGYDVGLIVYHERAEVIDGVRVVPLDRSRGRLDRMSRAAWRAYRTAAAERADIYHLHDPELLWVGALLKLGGRRVIYDVHEDVPKQILSKHWIPSMGSAARIESHRIR